MSATLDPATNAAEARAKLAAANEPPALEPDFPFDARRLRFDPLEFGLGRIVELKRVVALPPP